MTVQILIGDVRERLAGLTDESVHCCVTSPPYFGLRDYGVEGQIGLELTPDAYVAELVGIFAQVRRVLRDDGTLWLNLGDSYAGSWGAQSRRVTDSDEASWHGSQIKNHPKRAAHTGTIRAAGVKPKDLYGIPWRVAFALQADGWYLRSDVIWAKPNPIPESVTDRPTSAHEHIFLLAKSERYFFDAAAVKESSVSDHDSGNGYSRPEQVSRGGRGQSQGWTVQPTRNIRNVWTVATQPFAEAHFATFPPALIEPCVKAGCPEFTCSECGTALDSHIKLAIRSSTNGNILRPLRDRLPEASIKESADALLQQEVYGRSEGDPPHSGAVPLVRAARDAGSPQSATELLQQDMRVALDSEEPQNEQGAVHHIQGLRGDLSAGSPERVEGWLCDGASSRDGATPRSHAAENGDRASQERHSLGQPRRKSRRDGKDSARQDAEDADGQNRLPALRRIDLSVQTCPCCGANLARVGAIVPGTVLDCFFGAGTTGLVADRLKRHCIGIELNPEYAEIARRRILKDGGMFTSVTVE